MTRTTTARAALVALLPILAGPAAAQGGLDISLELPGNVAWTLAVDKAVGQAYSKEWVPAGEDVDSARWLIAQQKVPVEGDVDAEDFLENIYTLSANACRSATNDEIERIRVNDIRGAVGRTMCGHRLGTDYGVFSDRAVFVEGGFAYIITSELRIAPMIVDGVVSFGNASDSARAARLEFEAREEASYFLVRENIRID